MARCAAIVAIALCAVVLRTQMAEAQYFGRNKVHYEQFEFKLLQTEHFDIYYYAQEEEATRHAARMAERWYARFSRILGHTFVRRQPLVLYASHPHFAQTNLTARSPGEGTGGFTERTKARIAMPFAAGLGETDHVLGHEIAHAFQIDIARSVKQNAFTLPGWFIEGMAEYLSLGTANAHTMMWVRDAATHDRLPTLKQLDDPQYFPYRYGHALWSYLAGRYGDGVISRVLRTKAKGGVLGRLRDVTGLDAAELAMQWHASVATDERPPAAAGEPTIRDERARIHVGPALSPDGRHLMFLSERDRLSMDLFMADLDGGDDVRKVVSTAADPHFDSLQYIHSSGAWDAEGRRFAMAALAGGDAVLVIIDAADGLRREEIRLPGVSEVYTPSWSPDGSRIVLSALKGGFSDLFVYTLATRSLDQLTADPYADLHPAWSPDGRVIAFASDRFTSDLDHLQFGATRVALLDVASGIVRPLLATTTDAATGSMVERGVAGRSESARARYQLVPKQVSPQWAPDGGSVYFVSDPDGISNVYRFHLSSGDLRQVTAVSGGVSGITATSPSLAVASRAGTLAFSVFENGRYAIRTLPASSSGWSVAASDVDVRPATDVTAAGEQPDETVVRGGADVVAAPASATLAELLADAHTGLADATSFTVSGYDDRLRLESVSQPFVGASTGHSFGGVIRASFGVTFGDVLRDRQLQTAFRLGTDVDDFAAQLAYINRKGQWNWGLTAGFVPSRFYGARRALVRDGELITRETTHLRYLHQWGGVAARYNIDRTRRIELGVGVRRTGFEWQTVTRVLDAENRTVLKRDLDESPAGRPIYLGETQAAFVYDTAVSGPISPILGQRLRLEVEPVFGGVSFADVRIDMRRYFMPVRPLTLAARVEHVGRYGPSAGDSRLTPLVLGLQTLVRGYDLRTFAADECGYLATECSMMDELSGSRFALLNLEARAPLLGLFSGELEYGPLPIELVAFVDAGFLWTRTQSRGVDRDRFRSIGAGARANIGGFVLEMTGARPFDRVRDGWTVSFLLRPGW